MRRLPGPFDVIVLVDTLGALDDCQAHVRASACLVHARDPSHHRLFFAPLVSRAEIRGSCRAENAAAAAKRSLSRRCRARWLRSPISRRSKAKRRLLLPLRAFGTGPSRQSLRRAVAADRAACACATTPCAARCGSAHDEPRRRPSSIPARNERGNIEPAMKPHSALCGRIRDHLRRRPFPGRHLGGDRARHCRLSAIRHQGGAAARQRQGGCRVYRIARLRAATC